MGKIHCNQQVTKFVFTDVFKRRSPRQNYFSICRFLETPGLGQESYGLDSRACSQSGYFEILEFASAHNLQIVQA